MKKIIYLLTLPFVLALMPSCNSNGEYVDYGGTICYSYWTFSFGTQYKELPNVNPATFKSIENWLGHDDSHVYFKNRLIEGANPKTIKAKKYPLCCDSRDYYYMGKSMNVANLRNFEVINQNDDDIWAVDSKYAYYDSIRIDSVDLATFKLQTYNTATDCNHVYRYGTILPLADPKTYVENWKGLYSRDKAHIWYCGDLLDDVDYDTFVIDDQGPRDKNGHFYHGERISEEEWKELISRNENLDM